MSTGADCHFTEFEPGKWSYKIQRWPYGDNDDYDKYGPFPSFARAREDMEGSHGNPGGWGIHCHAEHVHEFKPTKGGYRNVGFHVEIRVESLGPDATREEVIEHLRTVPADHPAWNLRAEQRWDESITRIHCEPCGQDK